MSKYVLFTGATGGTGGIILEHLLAAGHSVNAVLRSFSKSRDGVAARHPQQVSEGRLTFTEVPDLAAPDALHGAAKGAWAIVHSATPAGFKSDFEKNMIEPTLEITASVLRAAADSPSVRRVVITGTIVSVMRMPDDVASGRTMSERDWNPIALADATGSEMAAYQYSKTRSEQLAWEWMDAHNPSFDLVVLLMGAILGRSVQPGFAPDKAGLGGVSMTYRELFDRDAPGALFPYYIDVDDIARAHVRALEGVAQGSTGASAAAVPGNKRYLLRGGPGVYDAGAAARWLRKAIPELRGRVPAQPGDDTKADEPEVVAVPEGLARLDTSRADAVFGAEGWTGWRKGVEAIARDILAHEKKTNGKTG